jgi:glycosyltransferase involved in cell wall biosynthesis
MYRAEIAGTSVGRGRIVHASTIVRKDLFECGRAETRRRSIPLASPFPDRLQRRVITATPIGHPFRQARRRLADWLRGETDATYFPVDDSPAVRDLVAAFGHDWPVAIPESGNQAFRVYELRADLRETFPLGPTPAGRRDLLAWYLAHGIAEFGIGVGDVLAMLRELDRTPDRGLAYAYRLQPHWQKRFPDALTDPGWPRFVQFIRGMISNDSRWLTHSRHVGNLPREESVARGVNVVAHFRYASGLQEAALGLVDGFRHAGRAVARRDLPVIFACDWADRERYVDLETYDTSIYVAAVNTFQPEWYAKAGLHPRPGVRRIAVWYWELESVPAEWHAHLQWPDEVWAPTRYIAEAFRPIVPCPVVPMLPGVRVPAFEKKPRSHFGLPDDRFLFLFNFDMGSVMARKNPLAAIEAYRRAFRADDRVHFAIKVSRGDSRPDDFRQLKQAATDSGVTLIDRVLPRGDLLALLASADAYVSLHRAEGLGLGMAESMLLGVPVIATAYSGNLDFMTAETAKLVPYAKVPIEAEATVNNPYPKGGFWAEPSVEAADAMMRELAADPAAARDLGLRGQRHAATVLDPADYSRRLERQLTRTGRSSP